MKVGLLKTSPPGGQGLSGVSRYLEDLAPRLRALDVVFAAAHSAAPLRSRTFGASPSPISHSIQSLQLAGRCPDSGERPR